MSESGEDAVHTDVHVADKVTEGATTMDNPASPTAVAEAAQPPSERETGKEKSADSAAKPLAETYPHLGTAKVLVVEDAKPIRTMIRKTLNRAAHFVNEAENGKIALELLLDAQKKGVPYDLVFLDLMMPVLDGIKTLRFIRSKVELREMRVIILSAKSSREDILTCAKLKVSGYLLKPFKTQMILEIGNTALDPDHENPAAVGSGKSNHKTASAS